MLKNAKSYLNQFGRRTTANAKFSPWRGVEIKLAELISIGCNFLLCGDDEVTKCDICNGTGWVCENCKTAWTDSNGNSCCGAGEPCACNASGFVEFDAVIASSEPETVKGWAH